MDLRQIDIQSDEYGLVNHKNFMVCPVLKSFLENGEIDRTLFEPKLSDFLYGRLTYVLKSYFESVEENKHSYDQWRSIANFAIDTILPMINAETWTRYRSVINKALNIGITNELAPKEFIDATISLLAQAKAEAKEDVFSQTGRNRKAKRLTADEIYLLRLHAKSSIERFSVEWLEFCLFTGLRPVETETAEVHYLTDDIIVSCKNVIKNDKTAERIQSGDLEETRSISLKDLSFHQIKNIELFIRKYRFDLNNNGSHAELYTSSRVALRDLSDKALGYSISLSVGRKQFAANLKRLDESKESIASQMGHTDPTRAERSYGRAQFGHAKRARKEDTSLDKEE